MIYIHAQTRKRVSYCNHAVNTGQIFAAAIQTIQPLEKLEIFSINVGFRSLNDKFKTDYKRGLSHART